MTEITNQVNTLKLELPINDNQEDVTPPAPRERLNKAKQGRPRKYAYLELTESVEESKEEIERKVKTNYSSQYYQDHKEIKVICPICLKAVQKYSIGKHQKTKYCQLVASLKETLANKPPRQPYDPIKSDELMFVQEINIF